MEAIQEQLIDVGLNVVGYLLAAGIGILLYSVVYNRKKPVKIKVAPKEKLSQRIENTEQPENNNKPFGKVSFVSFGQSSASQERQPSRSGRANTNNKNNTFNNRSRRDRTEVIRIARHMLQAGSNNDKIKQILPISDGELALLQNGIS